ncbi:unnamed protein product, partial [Ectocarpus fasciculatus]
AANPTFALHVVHVFSQARDVPIDVRQLAGLLVKNYIVMSGSYSTLESPVRNIIKHFIIVAISDPEPSVRNTATNLLSGMSRKLPVEEWSGMVETIIQRINASPSDPDCLDGSLTALRRISEDAGEKMAVDSSRYPLMHVIPVLFAACKSSSAKHRLLALDSLISLLFVIFDPPPINKPPPGGSAPPSLTSFVNEFLSTIFHLATDGDASIRTSVCQAIVLVMTAHPDTLTSSLEQICSFMLTATSDATAAVAIEAAEFWTVLADVIMTESINPESDHVMVRFLLKSIPVLLSRMVLTAEQVELDRIQLAAEVAGEKEVTFSKGQGQSIYHHRSKENAGRRGKSGGDEDESGRRGDDDASGDWTVRKQCAGVFDTVCSSGALLPSQILPIALPVAKDMMQSLGDANTPAWVYVEAGILIIGALANGCATEMEPHLPVLAPFLCQHLSANEVPEVRAIACWVLGRYAEWATATLFSVCDAVETENGEESIYKPRAYDPPSNCYDLALSVLLPAIVDAQTKVQSAALSALNAFMAAITGLSENEVAVLLTEDRLGLIFQQVSAAAQLTTTGGYGVRNCLILCDLVSAICEAAGELVAAPQLVPQFLPFIMHQYLNVFTDDSSVYLFPIMESVTAVLGVVGMHVHVYAMQLVKRSIDIASSALQQEQDERNQRADENADSAASTAGSFHLDFVVCAFDILGALSESLVPSEDMANASIAPTNFSMLLTEAGAAAALGQMVLASLSLEAEPDVLQSSFALCGEFFRTAIITLLPAPGSEPTAVNLVEQILSRIVYYISLPGTPLAVTSNALWATGEALLRLRHAPGGVSDGFLSAVLPVLFTRLSEHNMFLQNAAVTLGRIAVLNMPMFVFFLEQPSPTPVSFFQCWCSALSLVSSDVKERNHAFMGLLGALQVKP